MINKIDEKEAQELKKNYIHYFDKKEENMHSSKFYVEDVFCDKINKDNIIQDQIKKLHNFSAKNLWL